MLPHLLHLYNHSFCSWINSAQENDNSHAESLFCTATTFWHYIIVVPFLTTFAEGLKFILMQTKLLFKQQFQRK